MALKDLTQEMSGLVDAGDFQSPDIMPASSNPVRDFVDVVPRTVGPDALAQLNANGAGGLAIAAGTVTNAVSSAWSSVSGAATGLWAKVTGKSSTPTINLPVVEITGAKSSSGGDAMVWLWVLLAAGAAYLGYRFIPRGKSRRGGSKMFSSLRKSGSVVKL